MLTNLRIMVLKQTDLNEEDQEDVMQLSTAYLEWEQQTLQRGEERGEIKGEQKLVIQLLNHRIGEIKPSLIERIRQLPAEQLEQLAVALLDFSTVDDLQQWLESRLQPVERE